MSGSYNLPNMPKSLSSRNSGFGGVPSGYVHQPTGNLSTGRFSSNDNPATVSQLSHGSMNGHSGITSRGAINVLGNQTFSNGINRVGGVVPMGSASGSVVNVQGPGSQTSNIFQQGSLRNQSLGVNSIAQQNHEFRIQNEDFPALQSFKGGNVDFANDLHQQEQNHDNAIAMMQSQHFPMVRSAGFALGGSYAPHRHHQHQQQEASGLSTNPMGTNFVDGNSPDMRLRGSELFSSSPAISNSRYNQVVPSLHSGAFNNAAPNFGSHDQLVQQHQTQTEHQWQQIHGGSQLGGDQGFMPPEGPQASSDQFGMLGLLNVMRMTNPDLTTLALGVDPQRLGLQLDSSVKLYKTFASPWSSEPVKAEPEYKLPECYIRQAPRLDEGRVTSFQEETLFYVFYSMPNDEAQLLAANELHNRGWLYHRDLQVWFKHFQEPLVKTNTYEAGSYLFFDPTKWQMHQEDNFMVYYEKLERRPLLPH